MIHGSLFLFRSHTSAHTRLPPSFLRLKEKTAPAPVFSPLNLIRACYTFIHQALFSCVRVRGNMRVRTGPPERFSDARCDLSDLPLAARRDIDLPVLLSRISCRNALENFAAISALSPRRSAEVGSVVNSYYNNAASACFFECTTTSPIMR